MERVRKVRRPAKRGTIDPKDVHRAVLAQKADPTFERPDDEVRALEQHGTYVVTCAQNNTDPEWGFLRALERYCAERSARLVVIPIRYKNPTSRRDPQEDDRDRDYWWHGALSDYLVENELRVHPFLRLMGNIRIQATAGNPLVGFEGRSKGASAIYGHSQLSMQTVATPQHALPKIMYSTGSVTRKNYSRTKAGDLAAFHHTHGAVVAEVRGDRFWLREVNWDGRRFYDLDREYTARTSRPAPRVSALYMGDTHCRFMDPGVHEATFGPGGVVEVLRPRYIVQGDVLDGYSISHHERGKKLTEAWRAMRGFDCLQAELDELVEYLGDTTPPWAQTVVTPGNHDDFLLRWLEAGERGVEPRNRMLYHRLSYEVLKEVERAGGSDLPNPLEIYCRGKVDPRRVRFLKTDESFQLHGVELGMHGHLGPNGSRGTARNLAKIGTRSMIGHLHSPHIWKGVYQVGTSSLLRLGYTSGPSSWFHTHAVLFPNGRRQMIHVVDGEWRG